MASPDADTYLALRRTVETYASALDRRDRDRFLSVFQPDGILRIHHPADTESSRMDGHGELQRATSVIQKYAQTCHFLGQSTFDVDGDDATGETYCLAHHLLPSSHGGENLVMHIRYAENLHRCPDGQWRFVDRAVLIDWVDRRLASVVGSF